MVLLPSLNSLRVFETVAKRGSIKMAAEDLFVTQSAVSQQIKQLEEQLNQSLFVREPGGLRMTVAGERLFSATAKAIAIIADALDDLGDGGRAIVLHASTSFSVRWLIPRLREFKALHPTIDVQIIIGSEFNASIDRVDFEIQYSFAPPSKKNAVLLLDEWIIPVCAPKSTDQSIVTPRDLMSKSLLFNSLDGKDWRLWARSNGVEAEFEKVLKKATKLTSDSSALELALAGCGVALVNLHYAGTHLSERRLVPAVDLPPQKLGAHYLISHASTHPATKLFTKWFMGEADKSMTRIQAII